ncbi:PREDICTED: GDSL esterase/lipase At4g26790 [Nelumbo nucifera]|uniref:GDSL esterase/lipase At4g26790 n=1 Tax=Nelumbo nucifera TaxID=4432 RepID=A0A1U7ZMS2_NELNU|nr:PREDICTED: GDSL esterase/lipase At4g26790 [Nelumbo nucifera]
MHVIVQVIESSTVMAHQTIPCLLLTHIALLLLLAHQTTARVPAVIVFGDSSVDSGNNNQIPTILKSNFRPYGRDFEGGRPTGRFSNGRIPSDFISEALGAKPTVPAYLDPMYNITDFATGVCFASAGTGYDNATSAVLSVIPLWKELEYYKVYQRRLRNYLGEQKANEVLSEALYLMSLGTNDFLENYYMLIGRSSQFTVEEYENFLCEIAENFIKELYGLGARKISLGGLPPMGCLPLERTLNYMFGSGCIEDYNRVAGDFNMKLQSLVAKLNQELPGIKLVFSNPYDILMEIIQNPSSFGFESVAVACCATGTFEMSYLCGRFNPFACTDANKYVFWDSFHPTEKTNRIISDHLLNTALSVFF